MCSKGQLVDKKPEGLQIETIPFGDAYRQESFDLGRAMLSRRAWNHFLSLEIYNFSYWVERSRRLS